MRLRPSYVECCFRVVEKLLFSLTFYIYYSKIFRTFQIIFLWILRRKRGGPFIGLGKEFIFFLLSLSIYIIKLFWNFFKFRFVGTQPPSKSQLVECALKIWQNFSNFEQTFAAVNLILKVKFWAGSPQLLVAAPFRRTGAAACRRLAAAPSQLLSDEIWQGRPQSTDVQDEHLFGVRVH